MIRLTDKLLYYSAETFSEYHRKLDFWTALFIYLSITNLVFKKIVNT